MLAGRADWLDAAAPYLRGGGATASVTERRRRVAATGPARHEGGSPNVIGAIALAAACHALAGTATAIEAHERALAERLRRGPGRHPRRQTYSLFGDDHDRVAVVAFTIDGFDSSLVSAALSAEHGIGVRDGKFCAHLLRRRAARRPDGPTAAAPRSGPASASATTAEHVERLLAAVAELAANGPRAALRADRRGLGADATTARPVTALPW